jgi:flavin-dependent dehydrogenase
VGNLLDVLVIGGGPSGAVAARAAQLGGLRTLLVEKAAGPRWKVGETLALQSKPVLHSLGLLDQFLESGHLPCPANCSCWGSPGLVQQDFIFNPIGSAWQLDRASFERMLLEAARDAGTIVRFNAVTRNVQFTRGIWEVDVCGEKLRSRWLVDASGRPSLVARRMGITRIKNDALISIFTTVSPREELDQDTRTYIEACTDGWWYTALMPSGVRTISFQTDVDLVKDQAWREKAWLRQKLQNTLHLSPLLNSKGYDIQGVSTSISANSARLQQFIGAGWLAVGDAAQSYDPLSGQGIFFALLSGLRAGESLVATFKDQVDSINDYADWLESSWARFVLQKDKTYNTENRWPTSPFWKRRQTAF